MWMVCFKVLALLRGDSLFKGYTPCASSVIVFAFCVCLSLSQLSGQMHDGFEPWPGDQVEGYIDQVGS